jgi:hypothetical protein
MQSGINTNLIIAILNAITPFSSFLFLFIKIPQNLSVNKQHLQNPQVEKRRSTRGANLPSRYLPV